MRQASSWDYDGNGRLTVAIGPENNSTEYGYDARGNVTRTTSHAKPGSGLADLSTSAGYDATCANAKTCNQPNWTRDVKDNQTDYAYDPTHGGVLTVTAPAPSAGAVRPQVRYGYTGYADYLGGTVYRQTVTSACRTQGSCSGSADEVVATRDYGSVSANNLLPVSATQRAGDGSVSATSRVSYDVIGNVVASTDPLGAQARYGFDADRNLTEVISPDPDGAGPLLPRAKRTTYNADGTVAQVEQGTDTGAFTSLQQVATAYDGAGRKVQETVTAGGVAYAVTQYAYDTANRTSCTAQRMNSGAFGSLPGACSLGTPGSYGADRITLTHYDALGRPDQVTSAHGTPEAATEGTSYTVGGKSQAITDANGNTTTYGYDGFDRPVTTTYPGGSYEQLTLDAVGNVTSRRLRDGQAIGYGYDALNRPTSKDRPNGVYWETDQSFGYDLLGHVTTASDSNGRSLGFAYDALGRMTGQSDSWYGFGNAAMQYDAAGRRTRLAWGDGFFVTYEYLASGEMRAIRENGGALLAAFDYDDLGRRTGLTRGNGTSTSYGYDAASRLTGMGLHLGGSASVDYGYAYNPAGQITTRTSSNDAYAWTGAVNVDRAYAVNGLNQYTQAGALGFGYDGRGNLTNSGGSVYGYTVDNQLATAPGASNAYDPLGRLFNVAGASANTTFTYDGGDMLAETNQLNGALLRRYVFGPDSDEPLVWYEGAGTSDRRYLHSDERGSIVAVTDNGGNALAINTYDEYGIPGANNLGRFQYTGQKWIPELGLYDYKARMYSATLGRFMQTDPIGYGDGLNWYNYVGGDPVNSTDSSGLCDDNEYPGTVTGSRIRICLPRGVASADGSGNGLSWGGSGGVGGSSGEGYWKSVNPASRPAKLDNDVFVSSSRKWVPYTPYTSGFGFFPMTSWLPQKQECTLANNFCETPEQKAARLQAFQDELQRRQRDAQRKQCQAAVGDGMRSSVPWSIGTGGLTAAATRLGGEGWGGPVGLIGGFVVSTWASGVQAYFSAPECK